MLISSNQVYIIDIDGTINDSSYEYAKWKVFCKENKCFNFKDEDYWCKLESKANCFKEEQLEELGIFNKEAMLALPPIEKARKFLWQIEKAKANAYYLSGRLEKYRGVTLDWLEKEKFPMFSLRLRSNHDQRNIPQVKREIVSTLISLNKEEEQEWVWIDDDKRIIPVAENVGVKFFKAPECWGELK